MDGSRALRVQVAFKLAQEEVRPATCGVSHAVGLSGEKTLGAAA